MSRWVCCRFGSVVAAAALCGGFCPRVGAQPANDACFNAFPVANGSTPFSNSGATTDGPNEPIACNFFSYTQIGSDIWYCYVATCTGDLTVSLCGSSFDTKLAVYAGCSCPATSPPLACSDDFCGTQSQVTVGVTGGAAYLIRVGGYQGAQGSGTITISCAAAVQTGACCLAGGACQVTTSSACAGMGGTYSGDGTSCTPNPCSATGRCCQSGGACSLTTQAGCTGTWGGAGTTCVGGPSGNPQTYVSNPNVFIPDNVSAGVSDSLTVGGAFTIGAIRAHVEVPDHTWVGDLLITLAHGSTSVTLWGNQCGSARTDPGFIVTFDDAAPAVACVTPYRGITIHPAPLGNTLNSFLGQNSAGTWTLSVADLAAQDTGTLTTWSITLDAAQSPCLPASTGACCLNDGTCAQMTGAQCASVGGAYRGDATFCPPAPPCPAAGACCFAGGGCTITTSANCGVQGGMYRGDNTSCSPNPCSSQPTTGACCLTTGTCGQLSNSQCAMQNGMYRGDGTTCPPVPPCPAAGACCYSGGGCTITTSANCGVQGGTYRGDNTSCTPNPCSSQPTTGACCGPGIQCRQITASQCVSSGGSYRGDGTVCSGADCNANGVPDFCENLADCDSDGTPDICQGYADCNSNGTPDNCELLADCNDDGVPDICQTFADCNSNGTPDICEYADDCNSNGTPDDCEGLPDCDADGRPDVCESLSDCNLNGIPDVCEPGGLQDCNSNGIPDFCEAGGTSDCNLNGTPDLCDNYVDCNHNGQADRCDLSSGASHDCNANGIPDECEQDCNSNGEPDDCDIAGNPLLDCNSNGELDACELAADCNANGRPDECDIASGGSHDCNSNGMPDECEPDCNGNGTPDDCDLSTGVLIDCDTNDIPDACGDPDCNTNGTADVCDIAAGHSLDCNSDGMPDECEGIAGDFDDDNAVDGEDVQGFVDCVVGGATAEDCPCADLNTNSMIDAGDITEFVSLLLSGNRRCPPPLSCEVFFYFPGANDGVARSDGVFVRRETVAIGNATDFNKFKVMMTPVYFFGRPRGTTRITGIDPAGAAEIYDMNGNRLTFPVVVTPLDRYFVLGRQLGEARVHFENTPNCGRKCKRDLILRVGCFPGFAAESLAAFPHAEFVRNVNAGGPVRTTIDSVKYRERVGLDYDVYIVAHKTAAQWAAVNGNILTDVAGGPTRRTVAAGGIQNNFGAGPVWGAATAGLYDVVFDFVNQNGASVPNGRLDPGDLIGLLTDTATDGELRALDDPGVAPAGVPTSAIYDHGMFDIPAGFDGIAAPINDIRIRGRIVHPAAPAANSPLVVIAHGNHTAYSATASSPRIPAGRTGTVSAITVSFEAVQENWTLTLQANGRWGIAGSVSGAQGQSAAQAAGAWMVQSTNRVITLTITDGAGAGAFAMGDVITFTVNRTFPTTTTPVLPAGRTGRIIGLNPGDDPVPGVAGDAVAEDWTYTLQANGRWGMAGSVSGAQGQSAAKAAGNWLAIANNGLTGIRIRDGAAPNNFVAGDQITYTVFRRPADPTAANFDGYLYLQRHLAAMGFVTISIDLDRFVSTFPGIRHRGWTILKHIEAVLTDATVAGAANGRIAANNIILAGHSRGGEAVLQAYRMLQNAAERPGGAAATLNGGFNAASIRGIVSISPTMFMGAPPRPGAAARPMASAENLDRPYLLIFGGADGDVNGVSMGVRPFEAYDRARAVKQVLFLEGANHNFFNTSWLCDDSRQQFATIFPGVPSILDINPAGMGDNPVSAADAQQFIKAYVAAFAKKHAQSLTGYDDYFRRYHNRFRPRSVPDALAILGQYREAGGAGRFVLDDFEAGTINTVTETFTASSAANGDYDVFIEPFNGDNRPVLKDPDFFFDFDSPAEFSGIGAAVNRVRVGTLDWFFSTQAEQELVGRTGMGLFQVRQNPAGNRAVPETWTCTLTNVAGVGAPPDLRWRVVGSVSGAQGDSAAKAGNNWLHTTPNGRMRFTITDGGGAGAFVAGDVLRFQYFGVNFDEGQTVNRFTQDTRGRIVSWFAAQRNYRYEVPAAQRDLSDKKFITLRVAKTVPNPAARGTAIEFTVTLVDTGGRESAVRTNVFSTIPGGYPALFRRVIGNVSMGAIVVGDLEQFTTKAVFRTFRFCPCEFTDNEKNIDLRNIRYIRLDVAGVSGTTDGTMAFDDVDITTN